MSAKVAGEVAQRGTAQDMARAQLEDMKIRPYSKEVTPDGFDPQLVVTYQP